VFWLQAPMGIGAFATGIASIALLFLVAFCIQEKRPVPPLARWSLAGCLLSCFIGASTSSTFAPIHDLCIDRIQVEYGAQP
jgi:ABC-type multidrug transport system permease subunit